MEKMRPLAIEARFVTHIHTYIYTRTITLPRYSQASVVMTTVSEDQVAQTRGRISVLSLTLKHAISIMYTRLDFCNDCYLTMALDQLM
jgi:hypothetical protein